MPKHNLVNLAGQEFDHLYVLEQDEELSIKKKEAYWICECDCGKIITLRRYRIVNKKGFNTPRSCGCALKPLRGNKRTWMWGGYEEIGKDVLYRCKVAAIDRNILFNITLQQIWDKFIEQGCKCVYTNDELTFDRWQRTASIDRIDSTVGYIPENIQIIHKSIQTIKWQYPENELIEYASLVSDHQRYPRVYESNIQIKKHGHQWKGYGEIGSSLFTMCKRSAIKRNIEFNITIEMMWNTFIRQGGRCNLTGLPLSLWYSNADNGIATASLDRINNKLGYVIDNIQWVHKRINKMKYILDQDDFINICHKITDHCLKRGIK